MKHLLVHNIHPGMIIGKDVYGSNNLLLVPRDTVVTSAIIANLLSHNIISVHIDDTAGPTEDELINVEPVKSNPKVKDTKEFKVFEGKYKKSINSLKNEFKDIVDTNAPIDTEEMFMEVANIFPSEMTNLSLFDMLHHMRDYDDSTYNHCLNVALISNVFGRWLCLPPDELKILTLCGLLHDIGKLKIPDSIIKKPGKLTEKEYSIIKQHPYFGYQILAKQNLDPRIAQAALLHHERCDGFGYPMGYDRTKIIDFALIIAIADVYDAMTSARVYREPLCPFTVIKYLESESMQKYDPRYFLTFNEQILNTYINADVKLSNGQIAKVVYINKNDLTHPIVRIGDECMDLSIKKDLEIESIV